MFHNSPRRKEVRRLKVLRWAGIIGARPLPPEQGTEPPDNKAWTLQEFWGKSVWDWLELLGVLAIPVVIGVGGWMLNAQQNDRQQDIEEQRAQDAALQSYFDQMSTLLIREELRISPETSEVRTLARSRTLTILSRLDPERRSRILQFLLEAELIQRLEQTNPVINLRGANLRRISVPADTNLSYADLSGTNLSKADLSRANLSTSYLMATDLHHANLSRATLSYSDLGLADLRDANLSEADLTLAQLDNANLSGTVLTGADLWQADLNDAEGVTKKRCRTKPDMPDKSPCQAGTTSGSKSRKARSGENTPLTRSHQVFPG